ncbi:MAG TPA: hypothetical protein VJ550_03625 [Geomonas sp.]|nr:hypothetical protein [Geomonas sp.]
MCRGITGTVRLSWAAFTLLISACSSSLPIHTDFAVPDDSLRLAQMLELEKRDTVIKTKEVHEAILASGLAESSIVDDSVGVARIYCCGGVGEGSLTIITYIPQGIDVQPGDIVELKIGHSPEKGRAGAMNTITRVVQRRGDKEGHCWWDPKDDRLWQRVLYCDWMQQEGWKKQGGMSPAWYRPPTANAN